MDFARYSRTRPHFARTALTELLAAAVQPGVLVDLGCGDGALIRALHHHGRLGARTYAVDLSAERVSRAEHAAPGVEGIVGNAAHVDLPDAVADGVICSDVIEHVPDHHAVAREIARLLKPTGWWYASSVIRGRHAVWVYRRDGLPLLDPTHVREYASEAEFLDVLRSGGLAVGASAVRPVRYPLLELAARTLAIAGLQTPRRLPRVPRLRVPGYWHVEARGTRAV